MYKIVHVISSYKHCTYQYKWYQKIKKSTLYTVPSLFRYFCVPIEYFVKYKFI